MNEDMTPMQRKLFNYLRNKEDIIFKKSVGYKDGKIVFLLVANEFSQDRRKWSRAENILDLANINGDLVPDMNSESILENFGLRDCLVK